jgi:hypothetical protein
MEDRDPGQVRPAAHGPGLAGRERRAALEPDGRGRRLDQERPRRVPVRRGRDSRRHHERGPRGRAPHDLEPGDLERRGDVREVVPDQRGARLPRPPHGPRRVVRGEPVPRREPRLDRGERARERLLDRDRRARPDLQRALPERAAGRPHADRAA